MTDYAEYIKERVSIVDVVERAGVNLKAQQGLLSVSSRENAVIFNPPY